MTSYTDNFGREVHDSIKISIHYASKPAFYYDLAALIGSKAMQEIDSNF